MHRTVFIEGPAVTHIGLDCKRHWFGLRRATQHNTTQDTQTQTVTFRMRAEKKRRLFASATVDNQSMGRERT